MSQEVSKNKIKIFFLKFSNYIYQINLNMPPFTTLYRYLLPLITEQMTKETQVAELEELVKTRKEMSKMLRDNSRVI